MSDAKFGAIAPDTRALYLSDEALKQGVDLLFFAARAISGQGEAALNDAGLGQAHGRALYFVARHPGLTVAELLSLLKVTKQSLNRVLSDLLAQGLVERKAGLNDKRTRRLMPTAKGAALSEAIWRARRPMIAGAFKTAGQEAVEGFRKVLFALMRDDAQKEDRS